MKKIDYKSFVYGFCTLALCLCAATPASATSASGNDTVSAIGAPMPPATTGQAQGAPAASPAVIPPPPITMMPPASSQTPASPPSQGLVPAVPPATSVTPLPGESVGESKGGNVMGDTGAREKHSGTYYDSNAFTPDRTLSAAGITGPRKVDPALEPGQKFVVVEKTGRASSSEAQYVAATRALKLGRYGAAMEMYNKLYKQNSTDTRILLGLALAQQGAGFNESAIRTYEDLLSIEPNNASAIINLMGLMKDQYPSVTLNKLMELRNKYPDNPGIPAQIGLVNAQLDNYDDALRYLEVAASMEPSNPSHIYNMAIISDRMGSATKAVPLYERALQMDASYGEASNALPREQIYDRLAVLRRKI